MKTKASFVRQPLSPTDQEIDAGVGQEHGNGLRIRILKIEADGDPFKKSVKPKIRIMGRWLERAGFKTGEHVHVTTIAPGVLELKSESSGEISQKQSILR
jgi:hypothetical protein